MVTVGARRVRDETFPAAAQALSDCSPMLRNPDGPLFPPLGEIRDVSRQVALAVAADARGSDLAKPILSGELEDVVDSLRWVPRYRTIRRRR